MEDKNNIAFATLLLATVAGYCDTLTFVAADNIFSAHVTGNFIVFAYQIINGTDIHSWIKLLSFPVFTTSILAGGWIASKYTDPYKLLLLEGVLLLLTGIAAIIIKLFLNAPIAVYPIAMLIVFAMGLQNAFGKLFVKETYGPTTMMTGNVTQASLDLGNLLTSGFKNLTSIESLKKESFLIGGFLSGCILGALMGKFFGLSGVILPGLAVVVCYFSTPKPLIINNSL